MLYLTLAGLIGSLLFLARRYVILRRGIERLSDTIAQRRVFLNERTDLADNLPAWSGLTDACNALVQELDGLKRQRAGHLAQLETTLGNLHEAVLVVDRDNYVLLANRATRTIFPGAKNILGQRLEAVLRSGEFFEYLDEVRLKGANVSREIEFVEGEKSIWVEATGAVIPGGQEQNGPWTLFVLHDITRQKQLERVRREFVANVSHELKTPLSVIKGYSETLVDDEGAMDPVDREQFIRTIHRHADRLAAIVDDLLTLARLESGVPTINATKQDLAAFVMGVADEARGRLVSSGHTVEVSLEPSKITTSFDSLRLTQVFANLIDNAQRHTPRGSRIEIGALLKPQAKAIEIWVSDNGPGIPSHDLPRIFERFYRVEKGRSREAGGTGLGLSIVKHIVQLHGGQISATSEVGKGTRVAFTLPVVTTTTTGALSYHPIGASKA